ncbi:MAG: ligase-associated DNA damage response endonuclease PdeM [Gemmatimonadales bacterium]|nr:MAG: ligase-associated DNA damage response endonuclease PdeM [Gemmatimonadales bacterium]
MGPRQPAPCPGPDRGPRVRTGVHPAEAGARAALRARGGGPGGGGHPPADAPRLSPLGGAPPCPGIHRAVDRPGDPHGRHAGARGRERAPTPEPARGREPPVSGHGAEVLWQGTPLRLLPGGAVLWPAGRTLFVADLHLGKARVFQGRGVPVPEGDDAPDLARLAGICHRWEVARVAVLGDLVHGPGSWNPKLEEALERSLPPERLLVRGNHDRSGGDPPDTLGFRVVAEGAALGPFVLRHAPRIGSGGPPHLAGHLHPVFSLRGAGDRLRIPCFVLGPDYLVLPAWGTFTGGQAWIPRPEERIYLDVREDGGSVVAIRPASPAGP